MSTLRPLDTARADELRTRMVEQMIERGDIPHDPVAQAFRAVKREAFVPEVSLETAYALDVIRTKYDASGVAVSSVSAPQIQAMMLEQARIGPGMRVLEVGSGGCNAALLAELVGPHGTVISIDIDPDIVDRARACLAAAGYSQVVVLLADAEHGLAEHGPFDRIVITDLLTGHL